MNSRSACESEANAGNAVTTVSATVTSGTSASRVVKVRLPATCAHRSSRKRRATNTRNSHCGGLVVKTRFAARKKTLLIGAFRRSLGTGKYYAVRRHRRALGE